MMASAEFPGAPSIASHSRRVITKRQGAKPFSHLLLDQSFEDFTPFVFLYLFLAFGAPHY